MKHNMCAPVFFDTQCILHIHTDMRDIRVRRKLSSSCSVNVVVDHLHQYDIVLTSMSILRR